LSSTAIQFTCSVPCFGQCSTHRCGDHRAYKGLQMSGKRFILENIQKKLVPWGTDGRLPLSGDFRSLIVEYSLTFRRASLTNLCLRSNFVSIKLNFYRTHFLPSSKSRDTKTRTNMKNPARSNLDIVL